MESDKSCHCWWCTEVEVVFCFGFSSAQKNWRVKSALMRLREKIRHAHEKRFVVDRKGKSPNDGKTSPCSEGASAGRADVGSTHAAAHAGVARRTVLGAAARAVAHTVRHRAAKVAHCSCFLDVTQSSGFNKQKKKREGKKVFGEMNRNRRFKCEKNRQMTSFFSAVSFRFLFGWGFGGLGTWSLGSWNDECAKLQPFSSCQKAWTVLHMHAHTHTTLLLHDIEDEKRKGTGGKKK